MIKTSLLRLSKCGSWICNTQHFHLLMKHFDTTWETIDESEISFIDILELTDLEFALDCTSSRPDLHKTWREFAVWCCDPIAFYITLPSAQIAFTSAKKYINDEISLEELTKFFKIAFYDKHNDCSYSQGLADCANSVAIDSANPDIDTCVTDCFRTAHLGMISIGLLTKSFESKQRAKFISLIS